MTCIDATWGKVAQLEKKNRYLINYPEKKRKTFNSKDCFLHLLLEHPNTSTLRGRLVPGNFGIFFLFFSLSVVIILYVEFLSFFLLSKIIFRWRSKPVVLFSVLRAVWAWFLFRLFTHRRCWAQPICIRVNKLDNYLPLKTVEDSSDALPRDW